MSKNVKISENLNLLAHVIDCSKSSNVLLLLFLWMASTFEVLKDLGQS